MSLLSVITSDSMHCGNCQPIMNLNYSPNCTPFALQVRSYGKQNIPGGGHTPASPTSVLGKDSSISLTQHPSTEINFLLQYSNTNMEDFVRLIYRKLLLGCSVITHAPLCWYFREPYKFTGIDPCVAFMRSEKLKLISEGYFWDPSYSF